MASTINASNTGFGGIVSTGDSSGELALQAAGTTAVTINTSGAIGVGSTPSYGTSGQLLTSAGSSAAPTWTTISSSPTTLKYVTDSTDITLANIASSYNNVGSTFSVTIPTTGYIKIASTCMRLQTAIADAANVVFGLRISSTNYWFGKYTRNSSVGYVAFISDQSSIGNYADFFGTSMNTSYPSGYQSGSSSLIDIVGNSVPTGTQTIQLIAAYYSGQSGGGVLKGTAVTTRIGLEFVSAS